MASGVTGCLLWVYSVEKLVAEAAIQAAMISGVGFSNPKCRNMNLFISPSCCVSSIRG